MTKIAGSGSISQRHGYVDPDPHQNAMDPEHWPRRHTFKEDVTWQDRAPPGPGRGAGSECWRAGAADPPRRGPGPGAPHGLPADPLYEQTW
jgi:hypothetical protein